MEMDSWQTVDSNIISYSTKFIQQTIKQAFGLYLTHIHSSNRTSIHI